MHSIAWLKFISISYTTNYRNLTKLNLIQKSHKKTIAPIQITQPVKGSDNLGDQ